MSSRGTKRKQGSPPGPGRGRGRKRQNVASSPPASALSPPASSPRDDGSRAGSAAPPDRFRERSAFSPAARGTPAPGEDGEQPAGEAYADAVEDDDEEEDEVGFGDDEFGAQQREDAKMKENIRVLLEHFDEEQMDRYEAYRRTGLTKSSVRRLVNQVLQQSVSPSVVTVVRGFAKVFVGEITERAREVSGHDGPLMPDDLREAFRQYKEEHEGRGSGSSGRKKMFTR